MATQTWTQRQLPRVQWGPVITGVLCAVAAQIVLGLFGVAFGFASQPGGRGLGVLAAIWELLTPIVASFIGAYVAVRIAGDREAAGALLHGAIVWCIGLIAGALFITGSLASGAMTAGAAAGAAGGNVGVGAIARNDTSANRARGESTANDVARGAAAGTGAAGVAALFGLGGALLGAAAGRREIAGRGAGRDRGRPIEERPVDRGYETGSGVAYGEAGRVTTRPPATGPGDLGSRDEPPLHH